jgi:hypothetical protein
MSIPMVRFGNIRSWGNWAGSVRAERGATVEIQNAELWEDGDGRFSTIDVARTQNKWNESRWFDVFTVLVTTVISIAICFKLGWI